MPITDVAEPALYFFDTSNLSNANVTLGGATVNGAYGGVVSFFVSANAGSGTVTVNGGSVAGAFGAFAIFEDNSDGLDATFNINGGLFSGATGGTVKFNSSSTATGSILIANAGSGGASGGRIEFLDDSAGDTAQVTTVGNGTLDISGHNPPGVAVGSIEGSGVVDLGGQGLTVGSNNLSTTFSGILEDGDGGTGGSLTKIGNGALTLSGANTYTGPTIVNDGVLLLRKPKGAGASNIMGAVRLPFGTLAGNGRISGTVSIGDGSGTGSVLAPGLTGVGVLTIGGKLTFFGDSTYDCDLNSSTLKSDRVTGNRVAIASAHFSLIDLSNTTLAPGVVFTIISNTSSKPIAGVFANFFDGGTITVGPNTLQANYEGGDGNDLTLTVVQ